MFILGLIRFITGLVFAPSAQNNLEALYCSAMIVLGYHLMVVT